MVHVRLQRRHFSSIAAAVWRAISAPQEQRHSVTGAPVDIEIQSQVSAKKFSCARGAPPLLAVAAAAEDLVAVPEDLEVLPARDLLLRLFDGLAHELDD